MLTGTEGWAQSGGARVWAGHGDSVVDMSSSLLMSCLMMPFSVMSSEFSDVFRISDVPNLIWMNRLFQLTSWCIIVRVRGWDRCSSNIQRCKVFQIRLSVGVITCVRRVFGKKNQTCCIMCSTLAIKEEEVGDPAQCAGACMVLFQGTQDNVFATIEQVACLEPANNTSINKRHADRNGYRTQT